MYPIPAPGGRVFIGRYLLARFARGRARHPSPRLTATPLAGADRDTPRPRPASTPGVEAGRCPLGRDQLLLAVWIALIVVSTATVGSGVDGVGVSLQLTVAGWTLVEDATGSTSGIDPACE